MTSSQGSEQPTSQAAGANPVASPAIPLGQRILILASSMVAVSNPITRSFFEKQFDVWRDQFRDEMIVSVLSLRDVQMLAGQRC